MIRGCTDKNVHATGLPDHLLFDHYRFLNALPLRAPRGHPSASHKCATAPLYERDYTKRLGKNVRFVRF